MQKYYTCYAYKYHNMKTTNIQHEFLIIMRFAIYYNFSFDTRMSYFHSLFLQIRKVTFSLPQSYNKNR